MNFATDWRDNTHSMQDKLKYILTNENTQQDVVLIAGCGSTEAKIKAHSVMLFIGSQVFEEMLEQAKVNNNGIKEIKIPDVQPDAMRFILKYIYKQNFDMQHEDVLDILVACLKFNFRHLAALCVSKLEKEISAQNALRIYEEARKMDVQGLLQISQDVILKKASDVFQMNQFLNITNEGLCKLLAFDELEIDEVSLFNSVLRWGKAECERSELEGNAENLRFVLKNVVPLIRFTLMTFEQFAIVVVPTKILDQEEALGVFSFLSRKNLDAGKQMEPPQWIFSTSARKLTVVEKSKSPTSNKNEYNCDAPPKSKIIKRKKLLKYLKQKSKTMTISGLAFVHNTDHNKKIQIIKNITGVQPGILTIRMPSYLDGVANWQSFTEKIISLWSNGHLIHIYWDGNPHPLTQLGVFTQSDEAKWQALITDNGPLNKEWKNQLDSIAPYFKQLQNAGVVFICNLLPFMNYKAYSWNGRPGKNGSLKLYQITHDYVTEKHGLHSILWTWSLDINSDMTKLEEFWPGENYVDVASVYMDDKKKLEMNLYRKLLKVAVNKPISMECIDTVPTLALLAAQPGWTWFTVYDGNLQNAAYNNDESAKNTFQSQSVINKENNDLFTTAESTK